MALKYKLYAHSPSYEVCLMAINMNFLNKKCYVLQFQLEMKFFQMTVWYISNLRVEDSAKKVIENPEYYQVFEQHWMHKIFLKLQNQ